MTNFALALPVAVILGLGSITPMSTTITIIQIEAETNMRGRVMSFVAMAFFGMLPIGSLLIGAVSQKIGAPLTMLCQGICTLIIVLVFTRLLPEVKPAENNQAQPQL